MTTADKLEAEAKRLRGESDKWAHLPEAYPHASAKLIAERDEALAAAWRALKEWRKHILTHHRIGCEFQPGYEALNMINALEIDA